LALFGQDATPQNTVTESTGSGTTTATGQTASTDQTTDTSAAANDGNQPKASSLDRSSPLDMQWVQNSKCPLVPQVPWWKFISHVSIVRYVERHLEGDWETYIEKWQGRLDAVQDIYERGSTAITSTRIELSGDALADYIIQMQARIDAISCLKQEAENQSRKPTE